MAIFKSSAQEELVGGLEKKFTRTRDLSPSPLMMAPIKSNGVGLRSEISPNSSSSSTNYHTKNSKPWQTAPLDRDIYPRSYFMHGRPQQNEEFNRHLDVLRRNMMKLNQPEPVHHNRSHKEDIPIVADPSDIDIHTDRDSQSEISNKAPLVPPVLPRYQAGINH